MVPGASEDQRLVAQVAAARAAGFAVRRIEPFLTPFLQRSVGGDERPVFEDADLVGENVHLEYAPPGRVGHAVEIAADADHAFVRSAPLKPQDRPVGTVGTALRNGLSSANASLTTLLV